MSSHQIESTTQYERLLVVMAELRERGRRIVEDARQTQHVSADLRLAFDDRMGAPPKP
jgi:hypothetical protein